jgi:hypothetical protein
MFRRRIKLLIITGAILFVPVFILILPQRQTYKAEAFRTGDGWGYNILRNGKIYIHQPTIPAIPEHRSFETAELAEKTAARVIEKIKDNKIPSLSEREMYCVMKSPGNK